MSPFNFENNIRSKMQKRELEPSPAAWEKLEKRLDAESAKKKFPVWIYAVAAVLFVVFVSSIFLQDPVSDIPQIVNENPKNILPAQDFPQEVVVKSDFEEDENIKSEVVASKTLKSENTENKIVEPSGQFISTENVVAAEPRKTEEIVLQEVEDSIEFLDQKAVDVAGTIRDLYQNGEDVSIDEVEALLEQARKEIFTERMLQNSQTDAMALLNEVEWELDKTFYDKVFYALGENFKKLATAYAERNK